MYLRGEVLLSFKHTISVLFTHLSWLQGCGRLEVSILHSTFLNNILLRLSDSILMRFRNSLTSERQITFIFICGILRRLGGSLDSTPSQPQSITAMMWKRNECVCPCYVMRKVILIRGCRAAVDERVGRWTQHSEWKSSVISVVFIIISSLLCQSYHRSEV